MNVMLMMRTRFQKFVSRPSSYFAAEWERMAARDRRSLAVLAIAVVTLALGLGVYLVFSAIGDLKESGADIRDALAAINKNRDEYLEAKARTAAQQLRLGTEPPQLVADIESAAREESVQIAESNERPPAPAGKRWLQREVDIKIRGVDLQALTKFLKLVETGRRPIFCTRLSLKRRFSEADKLDAEVTAVAFERVKDGSATSKKKAETRTEPAASPVSKKGDTAKGGASSASSSSARTPSATTAPARAPKDEP